MHKNQQKTILFKMHLQYLKTQWLRIFFKSLKEPQKWNKSTPTYKDQVWNNMGCPGGYGRSRHRARIDCSFGYASEVFSFTLETPLPNFHSLLFRWSSIEFAVQIMTQNPSYHVRRLPWTICCHEESCSCILLSLSHAQLASFDSFCLCVPHKLPHGTQILFHDTPDITSTRRQDTRSWGSS